MRLHQTDSIGVVIVIAFLGGCLALVGAVADAGFADGVADAAARVWPYVLAALVLWAIAAAAELGAHLVVSRATLPIWLVMGRAVAAAGVALAALGTAIGVLQIAGVSDGLLGFVGVLAAWARLSARPVGRLLHPGR